MLTLRFPLARRASPLAALGAVLALASSSFGQSAVTSKPFHGAKVNAGTVTCAHTGANLVLTLSEDFKVPDTPAPHWQVVDSRGNTHLLQRLMIKGDKLNKTVTVPSYVPDVVKVEIWCAFAETLLGETDLVCDHGANAMPHRSTMFQGPKANKGFVTHSIVNGQSLLTLSDDFVVPDTPAPHWQLVDSSGNVFLLNRLKVKGDKLNKMLVIPAYVKDVAKVQIWCSFAEVLLGEASFEKPIV
jgi:hypothetical protein